MAQTIGKRIMENRKRLGITQDALAEQLGVTAQAVSKWENDQSCPDITMLPKLAEIFTVTTDELLGCEPQCPVHQAQVVDENDSENAHASPEDSKNSHWQMHWESGNRCYIAFAALVLLVGALTLANAFLKWNASFWDILWPSSLLVFGLESLLRKFSFWGLGCTLFGGYYLIQNLGFLPVSISGELVFPVILVLFGISLLADALRRPRKPRFTVSRNGVKLGSEGAEGKIKGHFCVEEDTFECSLSFGENTHYIHLPLLREGEINCSFGELTVDLRGCQALAEDCQIDANCSFGELELLVPKRFKVNPISNTAFASIEFIGHPEETPEGTILLDGSASFGHIEIQYV